MSDHWDFYFVTIEDKFASVFVDLGIAESAPQPDRPWLYSVVVYFNQPNEDGQSTDEESEILLQIEDALHDAISAIDGIPSGRLTTDGRRELYYYSPSTDQFLDTVTHCMTRFPSYTWDSASAHDPEWEHYLEFLFPGPHAWQQIMNRQVVQALADAGDPLTESRPVSHLAYFEAQVHREGFIDAIEKLGFVVTDRIEPDPSEEEPRTGVLFERVDAVDWASINEVTIELFDLAQAHEGEYDGWETAPMTEK